MEITVRRSPDGFTMEIFVPRDEEEKAGPIGVYGLIINRVYEMYNEERKNRIHG